MILAWDDLRALVARHFGDLGDESVDTMTAICMAESGGETLAINDNFPRWQPDPESPYRYDYGLAQINSIHGYDPKSLIDDPSFNLACARAIWNWQGWGAWATFNAGVHRRFLPVPAVALVPEPPPADEPAPGPIAPMPIVDRPRRLNADEDDITALLNTLGNIDYDLIGFTTDAAGRRRAIYTFRVLLPEDR